MASLPFLERAEEIACFCPDGRFEAICRAIQHMHDAGLSDLIVFALPRRRNRQIIKPIAIEIRATIGTSGRRN